MHRFPFVRNVNIDRSSWDKAKFYPEILSTVHGKGGKVARQLCRGYERRVNGVMPKRWVLHTNNGAKGSSLLRELQWLVTAPTVSAHFQLGKKGEVFRMLDPRKYVAWANGLTIAGFSNFETVTIEAHLTPGEVWTDEMRVSLAQLLLEGSYAYGIDLSNPANVDLHRRIQHPSRIGTPNQKYDPAGWPDDEFDEWRHGLCKALWPNYLKFIKA